METDALAAYLHEHIPLSKAMGVRVVRGEAAGVELAAPLGPNLNHSKTAFGGSLSSLAVLSGWSLFHVRLRTFFPEVPVLLVIQRSAFEYLRPVEGGFVSSCPAPGEAEWGKFAALFAKRGKGRLTLRAEVREEGSAEVAGRFEGDYVAVRE
ncbi:MAG TPA: YiiD C-terminal domain-containing protein [Candidatus Methylacidiphilales bacterium]